MKKKNIFIMIMILMSILGIMYIYMINREKKDVISVGVLTKNEEIIQKTLGQKLMQEEIMQEKYAQYEINEYGNITINEYNGTEESIIIPNEMNGYKIDKINPEAFNTIEDTLEMIKIPTEVEENIDYIDGFKKSENLSNEDYVVYISTREYTAAYEKYLLLTEQERTKIYAIPKKFMTKTENIVYDEDDKKAKPFSAGDVTIPEKYDLRDVCSMTVDNQEDMGICYAYATTKAIETYISLKNKEQVNFSEIYLAVKSGQASYGSFWDIYQKCFRYGDGPVLEKPNTLLSQSYVTAKRYSNEIARQIYNMCVSTEDVEITDDTLKNSLDYLNTDQKYYVMGRKGFGYYTGKEKRDSQYEAEIQKNRKEIKNAVMSSGSVITFITTPQEYVDYRDNGSIAVMCHTNDSINNGTHNVSIIGWDDNFAASNFPSSWGVTKNGAWLALNSWGSSWGNNDGTFWISYEDYYVETDNEMITIVSEGKVNIKDANPKLSYETTEYTGGGKYPSINAKYGITNAVIGIDYSATYSNNQNVGTATVKIEGIGRYIGEKTLTFEITPRSLEKQELNLTLENESYDYTGEEIKPVVTVKDGNKILKLGTDYNVRYSDNINAGTATVTVEGIGNYKDTKTANFTINTVEDDVSIIAKTLTYTGIEQELVDVMEKKGNIYYSINTELTSENYKTIGNTIIPVGINAGTYNVYYYAEESVNYKSSRGNVIVEINAKSISDAIVSLATSSIIYYDGNEKRPDINVQDQNMVLKNNEHYTIEYENNINVGTAKIIVKGKDNYKDSNEITFMINPQNLMEQNISEIAKTTYNAEYQTPEVEVKDISGKTLEREQDYTVSYNNNKNAGIATVTVTGKNNYTGSITKQFTIEKADMEWQALDYYVTYDKREHGATVEIITENTEAILKYGLSQNNCTLTQSPTFINVGTYTVYYMIVSENYNDVNGCVSITINSKDINTTNIKMDTNKYVYNGEKQTPEILVKDEEEILQINKSYTVEYENNVNAGNAKITVNGIGNYTGKKEMEFNIEKRTPVYEIPSNLVAIYGEKLKDVKLPKGFTWEADEETYVGEVGNNIFKCTYTPEDVVNNKVITGIEVTLKVIEKLEIDLQKYIIKSSEDGKKEYMNNIKDNTSINELKYYINTNGTIMIFERDGTKVNDDEAIVKTGMKLRVETEKEFIECTLVVKGDNNGDGKFNSIDLLKLARVLAGLDKELEDEYLEASDIQKDGKINQVDLLKMARVLCGLEKMD